MKVLLIKSEDQDVLFDEGTVVNNLESADLLWFHGAFNFELVQSMLGKIPMVFYGQAAKMVSELIENSSVIRGYQVVKSDDPWDKRGFQAYKQHPLFEDLNGGFYSYLIFLEDNEKVFYYVGSKGKIVAVEKKYIAVARENPIIWEYEHIGKKILCIGGYLNFKSPNIKYCLTEAKKFVRNMLEYVTRKDSKTHYWPVCENKTSLDQGLTMFTLKIKPLREDLIDTGLLIHEGTGTDYTNLCGKRILANLRENGVFDEFWVHPFRFLKSFNFSVDGSAIENLGLGHKIYADRVVHENESFQLTSFVSLDKPVGMFQLKFKDDLEHMVKIDLESDTRIMWPFDETYNCGRSFNYDEKEGLVTLRTNDGMFLGFIKLDRPMKMVSSISDKSLKAQLSTSVRKVMSVCLGGFVENEEVPRELDFTEELRKYSSFVNEYLQRTVQIETNHVTLDKMFQYAKLGTVKFLSAVPTLGEGLMAGYANSKPGWFSARPGYAWYFGRDSEWVSFALLGIGDHITVKKNLELLVRYQRIDGKIFHELTSSGVVHYDAADATPLFLLTLYRYWKHTNDIEFVRKIWSNVLKAFEFCLSTDKDLDGLIENTIEGHGWIEGGKLYGSHAELYLNAIWLSAVRGIIDMARTVQDHNTAKKAEQELTKVESAMQKFYNEKTGFYVLGILDDGEKLNYLTVMTAVAVYLDSIDFERSKYQVIPYASGDFSTDWGVRIIGKSSGIYNPNGYHEGTVWPLFTGWVSLAEFKVGATLSAFSHLISNLLNAKNFAKGYISEVYHGEVYKPSGVCPHQAWSESMAIQPLIDGMIGFVPDAPRSLVSLSPQFPWNINRFIAKNLRIGDTLLDLRFERQGLSNRLWNELYHVKCTKPLKICFSPWVPKQAEQIEVTAGDSKMTFSAQEGIFTTKLAVSEFECDELTVSVTYRLPFELCAIERDPVPFANSEIFRLIALNRIDDGYEILAQASSTYELMSKLPDIFRICDGKMIFKIDEIDRREYIVFSIKTRQF
ncbi:MAG: amylo-alpha-1,6-glucosidase [Pseudothermotoga sp.]